MGPAPHPRDTVAEKECARRHGGAAGFTEYNVHPPLLLPPSPRRKSRSVLRGGERRPVPVRVAGTDARVYDPRSGARRPLTTLSLRMAESASSSQFPSPPRTTPGPRLDPERITQTVRALGDRIEERFPGSGLGRLAREILGMAGRTVDTIQWVRRPVLGVRVAVGGVLLVLAALLAGIAMRVDLRARGMSLPELLQVAEAAINDVVLLGLAVLFLLTMESRLKRRRALSALRELRAVAHIVDMHQLTKDPDRHSGSSIGGDTPSSPRRELNRYELARYLDYCSELLALNSKLAALYAQTLDDPVVLAAVDEVEALTTGLSGKIWQKLVILSRTPP